MTSNVNGSVTTSIVASLTALVGGVIAFRYHTHTIRVISEKLTEQRQAERTGRIRAEVRLRSAVKEAEEKKLAAARAFYQSNKSSDESDAKDQHSPMKSGGQDMLLRCVGTVVSPYTKRMGTPRQGALAPHARGFIQFDTSVAPMETVSGLELYSHAWVIFCFHANTDTQSKSVKTKVRPPRAGGLKVGQMATRSPHRPNPIGLSLVKIVGIDHKKKRLYISAFDLVHGTPVFDVKPVVPWDVPGHFDQQLLSVPDWVSQEDAHSIVTFTQEAEEGIQYLIGRNNLAPHYVSSDDADDAKKAIQEILCQDPRAAKKRGKLDNVDPYKVIFGSIELEFIVPNKGEVQVIGAKSINLKNALHADGVPLVMDGVIGYSNRI